MYCDVIRFSQLDYRKYNIITFIFMHRQLFLTWNFGPQNLNCNQILFPIEDVFHSIELDCLKYVNRKTFLIFVFLVSNFRESKKSHSFFLGIRKRNEMEQWINSDYFRLPTRNLWINLVFICTAWKLVTIKKSLFCKISRDG